MSIADKLQALAENVQKVYDAGYAAGRTVTITWDGATGGKDAFAFDDHEILYNRAYYKVSDLVPTSEQLEGGTYKYMDEYGTAEKPTVTIDSDVIGVYEGVNCLSIEDDIFIVYDTDIEYDGVTVALPSMGIYFSSNAAGGNYGHVTELTYMK